MENIKFVYLLIIKVSKSFLKDVYCKSNILSFRIVKITETLRNDTDLMEGEKYIFFHFQKSTNSLTKNLNKK